MSSRDKVMHALCLEENARIPVFEPYGVHAPCADFVLGRPCIATHELRKVRLHSVGEIRKLRRAIVQDWCELVKKLKFDAGPIVLLPKEEDSRPKMIGERSWVIEDSVFQMEAGGIPVEVDSEIMKSGIFAFEEYVKKLEGLSDNEFEEGLAQRFHEYDETLGKLWRKLSVLTYTSVNGTGVPPNGGWYPLYLKCFYLRPNLMKRFLKQHTRRMLKFGKLAADFGAELIYAGGDIADNHGPMISPTHYREFLLPVIKTLTETFHKKGAFVFNSSDGNLWPIIEDFLINSGVDGMMEIQVSAGMDLKKLKDQYGGSVCFNGSVDCQNTLVSGTAEQVRRETKQVISILSPGGGHILSSSNSIHPGVKPENFFLMLETARKYGKSPSRHLSVK